METTTLHPVVMKLNFPFITRKPSFCGRTLIEGHNTELLHRYVLAMALEPVPNILILDEPMSGVDMDGERQLLGLLDEIRTRYDLSVLISTHDFNTLHKMDKVILLKQKVLQMGTPEEVLASQEFQTLFYHPTQKGGEAQ